MLNVLLTRKWPKQQGMKAILVSRFQDSSEAHVDIAKHDNPFFLLVKVPLII